MLASSYDAILLLLNFWFHFFPCSSDAYLCNIYWKYSEFFQANKFKKCEYVVAPSVRVKKKFELKKG